MARFSRRKEFSILILLLILCVMSCSPARFITNRLVAPMEELDELYLTENDPQLVRESMPSTLKMLELFLQNSPDNPGLLLAAAQAFTLYGYAFVLRDAEVAIAHDVDEARRLRERSSRLFLRAREFAFRALEVKYPRFRETYFAWPVESLNRVEKEDVCLLYWAAVSWGSLISSSKDNPGVIVDLPHVGRFLERALELDDGYDKGAIHEVMISYSINRPDAGSAGIEKAEHHYERALELSGGNRASVYVNYAESICVRKQEREEFLNLLDQAISIDVDEDPSSRLANLVAQEKARWLKERVDELFF